MAIITYWSNLDKETNQTTSLLATAVTMGFTRNYRCLIVDADFASDDIERSFWPEKKENALMKELGKGKVDIASGPEGLISAIASNKSTPEIIRNYTKVLMTDSRCDVLVGLGTRIKETYTNSLMLYKDLLEMANKYYDLIFVDLGKTLTLDPVKKILEISDIIMFNLSPNLNCIKDYIKLMNAKNPLLPRHKVIPLLGKYDRYSEYCSKNVARVIGERKGMCGVPYNNVMMESQYKSEFLTYFYKLATTSNSGDKNEFLKKELDNICDTIIYKLQELQARI